MDEISPESGSSEKLHQSHDNREPGNGAHSSKGNSPHWYLMAVVILLIGVLIYKLNDNITPITLSIALLILLYPLRRIRELKGLLLILCIITALLVWNRLATLLVPFGIAFILAYALNPVVDWLVKRKLPRLLVILSILGLIIGSMVGVGILLVPKLLNEVADLAVSVKDWIIDVRSWGETSFIPWLDKLDLPFAGLWQGIKAKLPGLLNSAVEGFANWSSRALLSTVSLLSGLLNLLLIPVFTVYFLSEFNPIKNRIYDSIPIKHRQFAVEIYKNLNRVLSSFFRGQLVVSLFLATWIGFGLWLVAGVPYALLLGITAGLANLIPYIGTATAGLLTITVALFQPDPGTTALKAFLVFGTGQGLENVLVTPRVVGDSVGLHPLLVIFAVLLFANLFGFLGLLVAIPVAASIQVVIKLWIKFHRNTESELSSTEDV